MVTDVTASQIWTLHWSSKSSQVVRHGQICNLFFLGLKLIFQDSYWIHETGWRLRRLRCFRFVQGTFSSRLLAQWGSFPGRPSKTGCSISHVVTPWNTAWNNFERRSEDMWRLVKFWNSPNSSGCSDVCYIFHKYVCKAWLYLNLAILMRCIWEGDFTCEVGLWQIMSTGLWNGDDEHTQLSRSECTNSKTFHELKPKHTPINPSSCLNHQQKTTSC